MTYDLKAITISIYTQLKWTQLTTRHVVVMQVLLIFIYRQKECILTLYDNVDNALMLVQTDSPAKH